MNRAVFGFICALCALFLGLMQPWKMPPDKAISMVGFVIAILGLGWLALRRAHEQQQIAEAQLDIEPPSGIEQTRSLVSVLILLVGGILIFFSPMVPHGYVIVGIGVLGLLGFNVFRGGPLDRRRGRREDRDKTMKGRRDL